MVRFGFIANKQDIRYSFNSIFEASKLLLELTEVLPFDIVYCFGNLVENFEFFIHKDIQFLPVLFHLRICVDYLVLLHHIQNILNFWAFHIIMRISLDQVNLSRLVLYIFHHFIYLNTWEILG